jgi:hypothetical protein
MVPMSRAFVAAFLIALTACHRSSGSTDDAGADASVIDAEAAHDDPPDTPPTWSEARRARLTAAQIANEPGLAKNEAALRAHFGGALPDAIELQAVPLANGRQHLLAQAVADEPKPISFLVDAEGNAIWTRERPTGGITPPVRALTLTPRPDSGVALFFWDEPTRLLAARMWNAEGAPFADLQIATLDHVDTIAAAWWKGRGWIIAASFGAGVSLNLLKENGTPAWTPNGALRKASAPATRFVGAPSLAIDSDASWMLVLREKRKSGDDHVTVGRYDVNGELLWKKALDLGAIHQAGDRVETARARSGVVRVAFDGKSVEVRSDGTTS